MWFWNVYTIAALVFSSTQRRCISQSSLSSSSSSSILKSSTEAESADTPTDCASIKKYENLLEWLRSMDATINDKIEIRASTLGGGYGAFVKEDVAEDDLLFTVPRSACLTLDDATKDLRCGEAFTKLMEKAGPGGDTVAMVGYMAKEYLIIQEDLKNGKDPSINSKFGPYFATLPWERGINGQEHTLFWSDELVESLLKGSSCYMEATDLRKEADLAIRVLNGIVGTSIRQYRGEDVGVGFSWPWEAKAQKPKGMVEGLPEAVKGAFVCLLTRAFQDGNEDEDGEKLVPLLDIMQHNDVPNIRHAMRKEDGTVEVRARTTIQAGTELLNQYRSEEDESMPYSRFFTRFGFVPGIEEPIENLLKDKSTIFYPQQAEI